MLNRPTSMLVIVLLLGLSLVGTAHAGPPAGSAYLDGGGSKVAVILCHGQGRDPRWFVVDPLRKGIHQQLGYHTLSLQLPVLKIDKDEWQRYAEVFPAAYDEIQSGIDFLRKEKKVTTVYLMGHSMGTRMASAFLASRPDAGIAGFIGVGIRNGGESPLNSAENLRTVKIPVLDIYGDGGDGIDERHAKARAGLVSDSYTRVIIPGADHRFFDHDEKLVAAVVTWLKGRQGQQGR